MESETLFKQIRTFITNDVTMMLMIQIVHPHITIESSLIGRGCVLSQLNNIGKLGVISNNSPFLFTTDQQKFCTTHLELIGCVFSLTNHEHIF